MNKTTIGSSLIFVAEHCAWPLHRYDEKHPLSHSMICGLVVSFFDKCFKFQNTHPAKFAFVLCISSSKSNCLLNFKYRFIWLSIRGEEEGECLENGAKCGGNEDRWHYLIATDESRVVTGQFDCSQR